MTDSTGVPSELGLAKSLILNHLDVFAKHGLTYRKTTIEHSRLVGDSAVFQFSDIGNGITVELGFLPCLRDRKASFSVFIVNARGQSLNVREYLRTHDRHDLLNQFTDQGQAVALDTFVTNFLRLIDSLFSTELKDILSGTRWEAVPFDWKGYK